MVFVGDPNTTPFRFFRIDPARPQLLDNFEEKSTAGTTCGVRIELTKVCPCTDYTRFTKPAFWLRVRIIGI